ncbi:uncharacterized protein LOC124152494 [Haliotis rufescens]|uniref:uncharacterized protein LOC124152494 n=1 Tax=Haliotis rufescens TaxID=6454 RepID=UPI00201F8929|nr:uncharacterized protein LOC124152494 [Haliotis rufescens]
MAELESAILELMGNKILIIIKVEEVESIAKGYIMAELDPPFCEVRYINSNIGYGVFATQDLSEGDFVLEYHGELISQSEAKLRDEKYDKEKEGSFIVYFQDKKGKRLCVDATHSKTMGRFVNDGWKEHEKNCFLRIVQCENKTHICLFANRNIKMGEEFRFDYDVPNLPWRKDSSSFKTSQLQSQHGRQKKRRKLKTQCGSCTGCVRIDDCSECRTCKNMKKFGGPGTFKQKCMLKLCQKEQSPSPSMSTPKLGLRSGGTDARSQEVPTTVQRKDEKAVIPSTQPVTKSRRIDGEHDDDFVSQETRAGSQSSTKKRNRPTSLPRIKLSHPKRSKKCLKYSVKTTRKTRAVCGRNTNTISPNESRTTDLISNNTRSNIYDFDTADEILPLESGSEDVENQTHCAERTSAPGQSSCKDKDTAWFEGPELVEEGGPNTEEESQNVSSQNDMTYLTQRKYSNSSRQAKLDGIIAKLRSKSVGLIENSTMPDLSSDDAFTKNKKISTKRQWKSDIFEKEDEVHGDRLPKRRNSEVQESQPIVKQSKVTANDGETVPVHAVARSANESVARTEPLDLSFISHRPVEQCVFPFIENRTQDAFDETTIIEPNTENSNGADTNSSSTTRFSLVQSYQQSLSNMVEYLEKRAARQDEDRPSSRRKLVKKLIRKKTRMEDLLNEVSENNENKDTSGSSMFPRRRKLEGRGASRMLQSLYKTLMIQTAECVQERLDETSFKLQVTFKQDENVNHGEEQMDEPDEEQESREANDDKPETWKDISVLVKYTAEMEKDKDEEDIKVKEQISSMVQFLDTKISQLQGEASDVHRILKKTIKKIKKKMLILSESQNT